jgi:hypothetical protein
MTTAQATKQLHLPVDIRTQPDEMTCGPTCLDAVYRFFGDGIPLEQVIRETGKLPHGGTLAVLLAIHALKRGYRATIYTYNLQVFDPSWFETPGVDLKERLREQKTFRQGSKVGFATAAYLDFLELGGRVRFRELTPSLLRKYLRRRVPILTGLSATYLYRTMREIGETNQYDDIRGEPSGHFVVLAGYDSATRRVRVADPLLPNPMSDQYYSVDLHRLVGAIYLGVLTYDANFLVVEPRQERDSG